MNRRGDDRALASGIIIFVAMLVVGGLVFIALDVAVTPVLNTASNYTTNSAAQDQVDLMERIWQAVLVFIIFLGGLFIISRAVLEGRRP